MQWLKICALLALTLGVMRASSWALGWTLTRLAAVRVRSAAIGANVAAFLAFLLLLYVNLYPGESMDWGAVVFGLIVFVIYAVVDLFWRPWRQST
jgi:Na+/melibiose symporter-like transporter